MTWPGLPKTTAFAIANAGQMFENVNNCCWKWQFAQPELAFLSSSGEFLYLVEYSVG